MQVGEVICAAVIVMSSTTQYNSPSLTLRACACDGQGHLRQVADLPIFNF